jgi:hypothetical protein
MRVLGLLRAAATGATPMHEHIRIGANPARVFSSRRGAERTHQLALQKGIE